MRGPRKESERHALRASRHSSKPPGGRSEEGFVRPLGLGLNNFPAFIKGKNRVHDVCGLVDQLYQVQILGVDQTQSCHLVTHPVQQTMPERRAHQNDRNAARFAGLDQGDDLAQLIQRAESAGQNDIGIGIFHESDFACKEMAE